MNIRNKHDRDPEWDKVSQPTQEEIIAFNVKEQERLIRGVVESFVDDDWQHQEYLETQGKKKIGDRIFFLEQQIAAGGRLDGYVLDGHKKELEKLKKLTK